MAVAVTSRTVSDAIECQVVVEEDPPQKLVGEPRVKAHRNARRGRSNANGRVGRHRAAAPIAGACTARSPGIDILVNDTGGAIGEGTKWVANPVADVRRPVRIDIGSWFWGGFEVA
jgi:hypothetical protein